MKHAKSSMMLVASAVLGLSLPAMAQITPGSVLGFSRDAIGSLTVSNSNQAGCPTRICTTNIVTTIRTNCLWRLVCTTNALGRLDCTNTLVCVTRTNTFPEITCTNAFPNPTSVTARETLTAAITVNSSCDELDGLFPSNAVLQAVLYTDLRTNDWRGLHSGSFKIMDGTNLVAIGSMSGVNGVGSHRGLEGCALCNHIEGTLHGSIVATGPLRGGRIQASYRADLTDVKCPSPVIPQGSVNVAIDGTVVTICAPRLIGGL